MENNAVNRLPHIPFKFIIIGPSSVGKSCILTQFTQNYFDDTHNLTVGVEFGTYNTEIEGNSVKLSIWDTCGQESFRSITASYYRGAHGVLLVYDVTRRQSFEHMTSWLEEIRMNSDPNVTIALCGNKCDLSSREVSVEEGETFSQTNKIDVFFETSAKQNMNIQEAFLKVSHIIYDKYKKNLIEIFQESNDTKLIRKRQEVLSSNLSKSKDRSKVKSKRGTKAFYSHSFPLFKSICDGQLMVQIRHILVWRSTFVGKWTMKQELNHQSRLSICVLVEQQP